MTPPTTTHDTRCLTTAGVSELTGIKQSTLRQWRGNRKGPESFRANGVVLYRLSAVEAWLAKAEQAERERVSA